MVKFSRELEAQLIPEWKEAFVNYKLLKKHIKKIKRAASSCEDDDVIPPARLGFSLLDPIRSFLCYRSKKSSQQANKENYQIELLHSHEQEVNVFMEKLDLELEKVDKFFTAKETEFCQRADVLNRQLDILSEVKQILENYESNMVETDLDEGQSNNNNEIEEAIITVLENNGVNIIVSPTMTKTKKGVKPKSASLRIDIPPLTPSRTLSVVTAVIWEDLINGVKNSSNNGNGNVGGVKGSYITSKKVQCAEKMIRAAYVELYRAIGLLRTYSNLNMRAFTKILKKFGKVSHQNDISTSFLKKVRSAHFISSDQVIKVGDEVESKFIEQFAGNDRKKAMKFLRPLHPKDSHMITFFVGLFTGSFVTLFSVYAVLAHLCGIFSSNQSGYIESFYPVFSIYALLSLHIFLYGCNLFMWRSTRINHNFIFEFSSTTALKHRDAFLISASMMTTLVGAMVIHLVLNSTAVSAKHTDTLPGILSLIIIVIFICPFNVFYRPTRFCLLRVIRNIVLAPFYRVVMVDFFMADQLTSQIPLLRHMEFTACYFMSLVFRTHSYDTCTRNHQYKFFSYIISFLPYYWRALQCLRRYIEEGYDINNLANMGKYLSAMLAAFVRMMYVMHPSNTWLLFLVLISSTFATCYQLYWDFVKDMGFFDLSSKNILLRDDLILKNKFIYYVSMGINLVLRLAWIESVMHINVGPNEHRLLEFFLASLEVIRRGHWNFYRLENEHLNNVGKFRAVKTVPLPFREMDSD